MFVRPILNAVVLAAPEVIGGTELPGNYVEINRPSTEQYRYADFDFPLQSSNTTAATVEPPAAHVPAGYPIAPSVSNPFTIKTTQRFASPTPVVVKAGPYRGFTATATLLVRPPKVIEATLLTPEVVGGNNAYVRIKLDAAAWEQGRDIQVILFGPSNVSEMIAVVPYRDTEYTIAIPTLPVAYRRDLAITVADGIGHTSFGAKVTLRYCSTSSRSRLVVG